MRDFIDVTAIFLLISGAIGVASVALIFAVNPRICEARWPDASTWSFWGGCKITTERGLIPENAIRFNDVIVRKPK